MWKIIVIGNKIPNYSVYSTSNDFTKFSFRIFDVTLNQAKVASDLDIVDFITKADFDEKLK